MHLTSFPCFKPFPSSLVLEPPNKVSYSSNLPHHQENVKPFTTKENLEYRKGNKILKGMD